jgi:hypothetical protein
MSPPHEATSSYRSWRPALSIDENGTMEFRIHFTLA